LTVVTRINHQIPGRNPFQVPILFDRTLETDEEPYARSPRKPLGKEWEPLDLGWVRGGVSMVILQNLSSEAVIEYGYGHRDAWDDKPCFILPPGEGVPFLPSHPEEIYVRSPLKEAAFAVTVIPS
jgi:hypothetical protein